MAGKPACSSPSEWGDTHLLTDLSQFELAMRAFIEDKFSSVPDPAKEVIFQKIDADWGRERALEKPYLILEAMEWL